MFQPAADSLAGNPFAQYCYQECTPGGIQIDFPAGNSCNEIRQEYVLAPLTLPVTNGAQPTACGSSQRFAFLVAAGIFLSRIAGLIRDRVFAHYFGNSDAADAFKAALRIPNFLQNLFGEGVLSASFIPVYANLLARDDEKEARRVAGAIAGLLGLTTSVLVLVGVSVTPYLIDAIAPGFSGEKRELTIRLVRILFPSAGLLVFSAWCLGVLNSHRRFFLSYSVPVIWNAAMIAAMWKYGGTSAQSPLAVIVAWGSVAGSALQVGVQLPVVLRLLGQLRFSLRYRTENVRTVVENFFPVFVSRGVVQISAYIDQIIASWLPTGAVAALAYAQTLYLLPVSLFGMSVSAAELPAMSGAIGSDSEVAEALRKRLDAGLRQIAFFVLPSVVAFLALGDVIVAAIYQTGQFKHADTIYVWAILAGATVGLLASTLSRLYASTYYALRDTRTPLRFAIVRVILTTFLGYLCALPLPARLGIEARWGAVGLTISAGIASWVEFTLLRKTLNRRIGHSGLPLNYLARLWAAALPAAAVGLGVRYLMGHHSPVLMAIVVLGPYGIAYFGFTFAMGLEESRALFRRFHL
ncbi:MAG TPA: murein biosynthesis integral membrane protein MurJ [Candidatus Sulfotelmatobacter sp.]|nr:murein biosynthesis integral membrane protein MurJ [Candidatus Sulfotelmatobacter sp.]